MNGQPLSHTAQNPAAANPPGPHTTIATLLQELRTELWQQQHRNDSESAEAATPPTIAPVPAATLDAAVKRYQLPPIYRAFLEALGSEGITIFPGPFQQLEIATAAELDQAQVGFRGAKIGDESFVAPHGWRRSWIVLATDNGDPYFVDTTKMRPDGEGPIWMAMHGTGTWGPHLVASSFSQFLRILRVWARFVVPHYDPQNPDEPLDDVQLRRLTSEIKQIDAAAADHWTI